MNHKNYKLALHKTQSNTCLSLSCRRQIIRKWYGVFAEQVFKKIEKTSPCKDNVIYFDKNQIQIFFVDMTCLHQKAICHYRIDKDLINSDFPRTHLAIAKSLLLQIRMHEQHPSRETLMNYYFNEFNYFDESLFDQTLKQLIDKQLIQSITTEDGGQYYDQNPEPHDHIYFKYHQKLVDCPSEITFILNNLPLYDKKPINQGHIYYVNNPLN